MNKKHSRKTSSLHIDNELHAEFKVYCAVQREKIQEVTEKLIKNEINTAVDKQAKSKVVKEYE